MSVICSHQIYARFFGQNAPNSFSAGAPPQISLGAYSALPDPLTGRSGLLPPFQEPHPSSRPFGPRTEYREDRGEPPMFSKSVHMTGRVPPDFRDFKILGDFRTPFSVSV